MGDLLTMARVWLASPEWGERRELALKRKLIVMTRKHWLILGILLLVVCILVAGAGALWLVRNVPGAARLVYGDPASPTPPPTLRATFTPLVPVPTLTPVPTASAAPTLTPAPTASTTPPLAPVSTQTDAQPIESPTAVPSLTPTPETPTPTPAPPTMTPRPQWVAFETDRGELGDYEVFVMAPDGSRLANASHSWADDVAPVWSPDGRRIAFVSFRDTLAGKWGLGPGTIYVLDFDPNGGVDVGDARRVTDKNTDDGWPTWSPNGQRIAFESSSSGNWDIWVINVDGSGLTNLTHSPEDERYPAWSPNGKKIAFTSKRTGDSEVWVMNADGSKPVNLTQNPARDRYAMWSPDGKRIAFNTGRDGNQEIYVMNADGSKPANVTRAPDSIEGLADWSPDGRRLVLYSDRPGNKDVFVLDLASGLWTNLTKHPASDEFCTWSP